DATGTRPLPNQFDGVVIFGGVGNTVGGTVAGAANVLSGNGEDGIGISPGTNNLGGSGNLVVGNFIRTHPTRTGALGNHDQGIGISGSGNTVGGTAASARNVIAANGGFGVGMGGPQAYGNVVQGNFVGTDVSGTRALGNSRAGMFFGESTGNTVGG